MHLLKLIQAALRQRWDARLAQILFDADQAEGTKQEIYLSAYRQAYWDAVVDLISQGLVSPNNIKLKEPAQIVYH